MGSPIKDVAADYPHPENALVVEKLNAVADLLEQQSAGFFRIRAYRAAAQQVASLKTPVSDLLKHGGRRALVDLPDIGTSIAASIEEIVETGHLGLVDRLRGESDPVRLFQTVPMIGPQLAQEIHSALDLETLEALEVAAYDGRLESVSGIGPRRLRSIRHSLGEMLSRRWPKRDPGNGAEPDIVTLLEIDRAYRQRAAEGDLPRIAPRRFNPAGEFWLPVMHVERGGFHFTVLFSNTARAHRFGRTDDWVVIFYQHDGDPEGQCTVVTENRGPLAGYRVVRGRETASADYYRRNDRVS